MMTHDEQSIDRLEKLMAEKTFSELTAEEKEWVLRFVESDEEYDSIRSVDTLLASIEDHDVLPDPATIRKLRARTRPTSPLASLFQAKIPAWTFALTLVAGCFGTWLLSPRPSTPPQIVERRVIEKDTVVVVRPDTVVVQKIIYRERPANPFLQVQSGNHPVVEKAPDGATMKEKEELQSLLVSGSDR